MLSPDIVIYDRGNKRHYTESNWMATKLSTLVKELVDGELAIDIFTTVYAAGLILPYFRIDGSDIYFDWSEGKHCLHIKISDGCVYHEITAGITDVRDFKLVLPHTQVEAQVYRYASYVVGRAPSEIPRARRKTKTKGRGSTESEDCEN